IRDFEYLSSAYRQNPLVRYQLALAYLLYSKDASDVNRRNAVYNAEKSLNDAVNLEPRFDQATLLLADLNIRKGNPAAAVDLLLPVTKDRPQIAQAQYLLASAYLAQQKSDQAATVYRQMTELLPKDPQPSFLLGNALLRQGQQAEARKAFE